MSNLTLIYTPAWALHNLEIYEMPKGYIINMTKALTITYIQGTDYITLYLVFHSSAEVVSYTNIEVEETEESYLLF